ncbi:hypothetical protein NPIL_604191 [Nephila pilipes]|uniref:Uncharacterized protein n=1 Tax=Nephila pilipes TaxID=299642 RepID=A0A8X6QWI4_NEPPI|nr:hypothetical protein NPIL_604191 [Nephila pilipes]
MDGTFTVIAAAVCFAWPGHGLQRAAAGAAYLILERQRPNEPARQRNITNSEDLILYSQNETAVKSSSVQRITLDPVSGKHFSKLFLVGDASHPMFGSDFLEN